MYIVLMQHIAEKLLSKCNGCLLAITIIGAILWANEAQCPEKWKDVYDKFKDYANEAPTVEDYKGESKTIFAAIELSLKYGLEESDRVGMENILQTLSLLRMWACPAIVVHLVWSYLQPERELFTLKCYWIVLLQETLWTRPLWVCGLTKYFCKTHGSLKN